MDRLQSAMDKARAARAARQPAGATLQPGAEAWAALRRFTPDRAHLLRNRVLTLRGSSEAMPYDILRTRMLKEMRAQGWRRVAVTSPSSGCGKTTLCANLALSLARQTDQRTLLVEADMRRPTLAAMLGIADAPQFSETLAGRANLTEHLLAIGLNLCLAVNRAAVPGAAELLQSPGVPAVLERLERLLTPGLTLFDMPPMLRGDDTLGFLDQVDCALLVVEAEVTPVQDVEACERDLARHTNVMGVVLNKMRHAETAYGYGD